MIVSESAPETTKRLAPPIALAVLLVLATLVTGRSLLTPPAPLPADAPEDVFSAGRALAVLTSLLGDGAPHPVGSADHDRVRDGLLDGLRTLGYTPEVHRETVAGGGRVTEVENVIARLPGAGGREAVAIAAHYDSVHAGPGAADDLAGVAAIVEIARVLKAGPKLESDVVLLITDGEEMGLLGAGAFAEQHPWAREVGAVVNLEARGTAGPSILFETGRDDAALIDAFARTASRPVTASAFTWIYKQMPNDTDFTQFRRAGWTGVNFAFIEGVQRYHTPLDDLDHLDQGSLQQHGDNALGMIRALAKGFPDEEGDAVYFDVFGLAVVRWPVGATLPLALLGLLATLALAWRRVAAEDLSWRDLSRGVGGALLLLLAAPATAVVVGMAVRLGRPLVDGVAYPIFPADPFPLALALGCAVLAGGTLVAGRFVKSAGALTHGIWTVLAALAVAGAILAPQASYPLVVPVVIAGAARWGARWWSRGAVWIEALVPTAALALLWAPFLIFLPDALGFVSDFVVAGPATFVFLGLAGPLAAGAVSARRAIGVAAAVVAAGAVVWAFVAPHHTPDRPHGVILRYVVDADSGDAWHTATVRGSDVAADSALGLLLPSGNHTSFARPGWGRTHRSAPAPLTAVFEAPHVTGLNRKPDGDVMEVTGRIVSPRGAAMITLAFPNDGTFSSIEIEGRPVLPRWRGDVLEVRLLSVPAAGWRFSFRRAGKQRVEVQLIDETPGLPAACDDVVRARDGIPAVPWQFPDATLVGTRVRF
jgi:peptidase M28-like protein